MSYFRCEIVYSYERYPCTWRVACVLTLTLCCYAGPNRAGCRGAGGHAPSEHAAAHPAVESRRRTRDPARDQPPRRRQGQEGHSGNRLSNTSPRASSWHGGRVFMHIVCAVCMTCIRYACSRQPLELVVMCVQYVSICMCFVVLRVRFPHHEDDRLSINARLMYPLLACAG